MLMFLLRVGVYLVPGAFLFIILPAVAFFAIEDSWTFLDSVYFAFITLTTIGFGDFVAGNFLEPIRQNARPPIFVKQCQFFHHSS